MKPQDRELTDFRADRASTRNAIDGSPLPAWPLCPKIQPSERQTIRSKSQGPSARRERLAREFLAIPGRTLPTWWSPTIAKTLFRSQLPPIAPCEHGLAPVAWAGAVFRAE